MAKPPILSTTFVKHGLRSQAFKAMAIFLFVAHCTGTPPPTALPPSESDLNFLPYSMLCQSKIEAQADRLKEPVQEAPWGGGQKVFQHFKSPHEYGQWLMFNEDQILVGIITVFPKGLSLNEYPVLRHTLSQLPPAREFFFQSSQLLQGQAPESGTLYRTGEATTTHQYFIRHGPGKKDQLVMTVFVLDPYESLLDGSHTEFLSYLQNPSVSQHELISTGTSKNSPQEFLGLQQFARGEIALFASCGNKKPETALDAYQQAIKHGISDTKQQAEAHHRRGLALRLLGRLAEAETAMQQALAIQPHSAGILNSYGSVLAQREEWPKAIETFEQALALQPDYAQARFNLAEAYEALNPKRAIQEYETFLILAEGKPDAMNKVDLARSRIKILQSGGFR